MHYSFHYIHQLIFAVLYIGKCITFLHILHIKRKFICSNYISSFFIKMARYSKRKITSMNAVKALNIKKIIAKTKDLTINVKKKKDDKDIDYQPSYLHDSNDEEQL